MAMGMGMNTERGCEQDGHRSNLPPRELKREAKTTQISHAAAQIYDLSRDTIIHSETVVPHFSFFADQLNSFPPPSQPHISHTSPPTSHLPHQDQIRNPPTSTHSCRKCAVFVRSVRSDHSIMIPSVRKPPKHKAKKPKERDP